MRGQVPFDLHIAFGHQLLVIAIGAQGLTQREEMLRAIVADERLRDGLRRRVDVPVAQCRERGGVALAAEDGVDNRESREPGDIADHMMNLEII